MKRRSLRSEEHEVTFVLPAQDDANSLDIVSEIGAGSEGTLAAAVPSVPSAGCERVLEVYYSLVQS